MAGKNIIIYDGQYGERCETLENAASGAWTRIATYGDVPNVTPAGERVVQRFEKVDAEKIVSTFANNWARLKKFFGVGNGNIPVVRGHTDTGNVDDETLVDTTQYAQIAAMQAREDGLYAQISKSPEFGQLLANGEHLEYSPTWRVQEESAGSGVFRPFRLISLGMVPKGNLRNATLVNEAFGGDGAAKKQTEKENDMEWTDEQKDRLAAVLGVEAEVLGDAEAVIAAISGKVKTAEPPKDDKKPSESEEDKKKKEAAKVLVNAAFVDSVILANEVATMTEMAESDYDGAKAMLDARREKAKEAGRSTTLKNAEAAAKAKAKTAADRDSKITTMVNNKIAEYRARGVVPPRTSALWAQAAEELDAQQG